MKASTAFALASSLSAGARAASNASSPYLLSSGNVQLGEWSAAYQQAKTFVAGLTNDQKVSIITGSSLTGNVTWDAYSMVDGPSGVQNSYFISGFGAAAALAMTWDSEHFYNMAKAVGDETYGLGYALLEGPTAEPLGRTAWGGRLEETFSPDPYLNGITFSRMTEGINAAGVISSGKHYLLNEQETNRSGSISSSTSSVYSSNADDKTLHETYLWPFYDAVKAGLGSVMCAMTKVNGTLSCENSILLNKALKEEMGFPAFTYPDVNGQSTSYGSANSGLDYGGSHYWSDDIISAGINNGSLTQARLDDMAIRNVIPYYKSGQNNGELPSRASFTENRNVRANHTKIIREIGADSMVLLKNTNNALPLQSPGVISVFGAHAGPVMGGPNMQFSVQGSGPTYQGHLAGGSGSGQASFPYVITPQAALTNKVAEDGSMIFWILNDTYTATSSGGMGGGGGMPGGHGGFPGGSSNSSSGGGGFGGGMGGGGGGGGADLGSLETGTSVTPSITSYAEVADVCLVFLNALAGEGADRTELTNADQDTLVNTVASECNNTIVVINTPGARLVDQWIENENVTGLLYGSYLGQESGNSIVDVLYGSVNPGAKLTYTIAKNESDYNVGICYTAECDFTEGNYIDYRYFDAYNVTPRYEFGYGLSYTIFSYSDFSVQRADNGALDSKYPTGGLAVGGKEDLWDEVITASVTVANTGSVEGAEIAQLYVEYPAAAQQPVRQLRAFDKQTVTAGDSATFSFSVRRRDVSYWDVVAQDWAVAKGTYKFSVGASSRDLKASATVTV
ncbi:glycoside hydrolase family 3 protein [Saccharata proteae CBS 121410]|uniref:beta-glucosidase n=1 Tax=Saccharata proteae CBS 121410 TaxID=1314787 RepID=A0A9P4LXB4_9PEZI|nr:glycoside hydrolase family 3 protein [Saccharata proteae CBS 121410]